MSRVEVEWWSGFLWAALEASPLKQAGQVFLTLGCLGRCPLAAKDQMEDQVELKSTTSINLWFLLRSAA